MKKNEFNQRGLIPLTEFEMQNTEGGGRIASFGLWVLDQIVSNWDEIKLGFKEGWDAAPVK
jgi:hypothetical protein